MVVFAPNPRQDMLIFSVSALVQLVATPWRIGGEQSAVSNRQIAGGLKPLGITRPKAGIDQV